MNAECDDKTDTYGAELGHDDNSGNGNPIITQLHEVGMVGTPGFS